LQAYEWKITKGVEVAVSYLNIRVFSVWLEEARKFVVLVDGRLPYLEEIRTRHFRMLCGMTTAIPCFQCEENIR